MLIQWKCDLNQIPYAYTVEVRNRIKGLDLIECLMPVTIFHLCRYVASRILTLLGSHHPCATPGAKALEILCGTDVSTGSSSDLEPGVRVSSQGSSFWKHPVRGNDGMQAPHCPRAGQWT